MNSIVSSLIMSFLFLLNSNKMARNRVSVNMPCFAITNESPMKSKVFFSFPMPSVTCAFCTFCNGSMSKIITQSNTSLMMSVGLASFFSSTRSFALIESTARCASSRKGWALARSSSAAAFSKPIAAASARQCSLITRTLSLSVFAAIDCFSRSASMRLVSRSASCNFTSSTRSTTFIFSTSSAPCSSFWSPICTRCSFRMISVIFFRYNVR